MTMLTPQALAAAGRYVLLNARLIDRSDLTAYANDDGGFGNALEPDLRGSGSQPQPVEVALRLLEETTGPVDSLLPGPHRRADRDRPLPRDGRS